MTRIPFKSEIHISLPLLDGHAGPQINFSAMTPIHLGGPGAAGNQFSGSGFHFRMPLVDRRQ